MPQALYVSSVWATRSCALQLHETRVRSVLFSSNELSEDQRSTWKIATQNHEHNRPQCHAPDPNVSPSISCLILSFTRCFSSYSFALSCFRFSCLDSFSGLFTLSIALSCPRSCQARFSSTTLQSLCSWSYNLCGCPLFHVGQHRLRSS